VGSGFSASQYDDMWVDNDDECECGHDVDDHNIAGCMMQGCPCQEYQRRLEVVLS
jgi:hypothetical protein